ncbi:hypothetical protein C8R43DRAFT_98899 [Mycena crocata]|nr:hypothetical protein C8R43DRAFT_98899 [Mycena crocata]
MPPRTRNGGRGRLMALGVAVNTTGLPALPLEILLEIISHFLSVPSPCKVQHVLSCAYLERPHALRALSETCKRLRSAFLARAWERIEVCASRRVSESYSYRKHDYDSTYDRETNLWSNELAIELATELVRQMEVVTIRNPALAQQVKTVTIVLSEWCSDTVLPDFFASLSQLPNLDTLQILYAPPGSDKYVLGHRYPSVRTLVLSGNVSQFMAYCPNVERIDVFRLISFLPRLTPQQFPRLRAFNCMIIDAEALKGECTHFCCTLDQYSSSTRTRLSQPRGSPTVVC